MTLKLCSTHYALYYLEKANKRVTLITLNWQFVYIFEKLINRLKKLSLLFASFLLLTSIFGQSTYWQQQVNYNINVSLNDKEHSLDAFERIEYINHSPDTLHFIWFHLWPNAYKNDKTAMTDQFLENGSTLFYFSDKEDKGYINKLDFKVDNITAALEDHPQYIDVVKLILPAPLPPGKSIVITTPFHVKLPFNLSRGGHDGESYQATQWYPKPAVYDQSGWHTMPYLDQGEFYSEYGNFEVQITVPKNYVVAATGDLQNTDEKNWLQSRANFSWSPEKLKEKNSNGQIKITTTQFPPSDNQTKTLTYKQDRIHDFAWFADKRFIVKQDTLLLQSGKNITVFANYIYRPESLWKDAVQYTKDAIRFYSSLVGEYPYNVVSVVEGPNSFGGGMEYPTITIISPTNNTKELDYTIAHEVGHNWFYGILGSNERKHPWMDEGINSYYEYLYSKHKDANFSTQEDEMLLETAVALKKDQPIATSSENLTESNYGLVAYYKTAKWTELLAKEMGVNVFNNAMKTYFDQWKFKHPQPNDFKTVMEEVGNKNLDTVFSLLYKTGNLPSIQKNGTAIQTPFGGRLKKMMEKNSAKKTVLTISPIIGYNSYDKLMPGIGITNYYLPPNPLSFYGAALYGIGSKRINGIADINYSFFPKKSFYSIDLGVTVSKFSDDEYEDDKGNKITMGFQKIVPGVKFTFKKKNPRSTINKFLQYKSFIINDEQLSFFRDSSIIPGGGYLYFTNFNKVNKFSIINQLKYVIENNRVLYPYRGELKIEQGKNFIRPTFTGNYFFNYPKGGGLEVRLFAGKFIYTTTKTYSTQFATDRYHLNMTGANGYEDYTYSDYFIGRNKFQGVASQQIMMRDGGFKVRTDLLASKIGKTDDWLMAANFVTSIPNKINPLNLLPIKIPLKVFVDIGTYSEAWKDKEHNDRFLYDAGLQLSLFKNIVNLYMPIVYSSIYKDYILSTIEKKGRFLKKISFSIDISNLNTRKISPKLNF